MKDLQNFMSGYQPASTLYIDPSSYDRKYCIKEGHAIIPTRLVGA